MTYCFRIKARFKTELKLSSKMETIEIPSYAVIEVRHERPPIEKCTYNPKGECPDRRPRDAAGESYSFICRGFQTEIAAWEAGRQFADALHLCGAQIHLGVSFGTGKPKGRYFKWVEEQLQKETGLRPLPDQYGLMVYEDGKVQIRDLDLSWYFSRDVDSFANNLATSFEKLARLESRHRNCINLINDAHYALHYEAQFILYISAVEALCEAIKVGEHYKKMFGDLIEHLTTLKPENEEGKEALKSVRNRLVQASKSSVRQSYMRLIRLRLGAEKARKFDRLYTFRSAYLHEGKSRKDIAKLAGEAKLLAADLLTADLEMSGAQ